MTIFAAVCAFWVLSEIVIAMRRRAAVTGAERRDRFSIVIFWLAYAFGPFFGAMLRNVRATRMAPPLQRYAFWGGLLLIVIGIAIRWIAIATLKRYFTVDVAIASDHKVIQHGIYGIVRHPSYSGSLLSSLGLGLAFLNWLSFAVVVTLAVAAITYRIRVEEAALVGALGDAYRAYAARTKRLLPGVF